jgi:pimeloyl-ACP methyl ester carboxylesterase
VARPHLLAISFGVLPATRAAGTTHAGRIGGLFVFGGYADFESLVSYTLTGDADGEHNPDHDPLDVPVLFVNVWEDEALLSGWVEFIRTTWGRPEMRELAARREVARRLGEALPKSSRDVFLVGCGVGRGASELLREAIDRAPQRQRLLDPKLHLGGVRCPVWLAHGRDDDVIPYTQLARLAQAFPAHVEVKTYLTGLFTHTAGARRTRLRAAAEEARTLIGMLTALSAATR